MSIGATSLPLEAGDAGADVTTDAADPTLARLASLLAAAIVADCGGLWTTVVATLPVAPIVHPLRGKAVVQRTVVGPPPDPAITQTSPHARPTLYVYRDAESEAVPHYPDAQLVSGKIVALWVCGALASGPREKLWGVLTRGVAASIRQAVHAGRHAAHDSGRVQFLSDEVYSLAATSWATTTMAQSADQTAGPAADLAVEVSIAIRELTADTWTSIDSTEALDSITTNIDPQDGEDEDVYDMILSDMSD